ncbi:hypothetical protein EIP86_003038 [Pleurotus ostreatoroseus]|nr:hypothetical protein EIP86_003038 [Pleurotus ostreatoroseus]
MSGDDGNYQSGWRRPANSAPRIGRIGAWGDSSASSSRASSTGPRIATFRDLASGGEPSRPPHGHDDEDEDEEEDEPERKEGETWYAGGERSGVSIQNPNAGGPPMPGGQIVRDLLQRATEGGMAAPPEPERSPIFHGGGHTLGGEDSESRYIPDPDAPQEEETAIRHLTFWRNGFTIEDGDLMRYDDPANAEILNIINSGRAPPALLGVRVDQAVELRVNRRTDQDYVPPRYKAFSGQGHRLGSPVPGEPSTAPPSAAMPGTFPTSGTLLAASASAASTSAGSGGADRQSMTTRFEVDQSKPTTSVQIRLADGTRLVCRMNLTHTVGDIRSFINASRPQNAARTYNIMTTFPNRILEDETQTVEQAGLVNSVVVQRWV